MTFLLISSGSPGLCCHAAGAVRAGQASSMYVQDNHLSRVGASLALSPPAVLLQGTVCMILELGHDVLFLHSTLQGRLLCHLAQDANLALHGPRHLAVYVSHIFHLHIEVCSGIAMFSLSPDITAFDCQNRQASISTSDASSGFDQPLL